MITEGEKKYLEHAIELAEYIDQKNMSGNLKSEILDKMLIPYGLSDEKKNGGLPKQEPAKQPQNLDPKNQPAQQAPPKQKVTDSVMDIVYAHPELEIDGSRVVIKKKIESKNDYFDIKDELAKRGWKYIAPRHIGGEKWEPGYFEIEGAKA